MSNKSKLTELLSCNIKRLRKEHNLTQEQLSEKVGISVRHLSDIERSDAFPSPEVIEQIAKQLNVPSYSLFLPEEKQRAEILFSQKFESIIREELSGTLNRTIARLKNEQQN